MIRKKDLMESSLDERVKTVRESKAASICCADKWSDVEPLSVSNYPWNITEPITEPGIPDTGTNTNASRNYSTALYIPGKYVPEMHAKLFYNKDGIYVSMNTYEKYPRATYHEINDPVCKDSCQEFFFQPCPQDDESYFNFEFNPWGTYLHGIGKNRYDLSYIDENISASLFSVKSRIEKTMHNTENMYHWCIEFLIPLDYIIKFFKTFKLYSGKLMRGNFYKCGDDTIYPHFGCWNKVINEVPDFHRPESFGTLILE